MASKTAYLQVFSGILALACGLPAPAVAQTFEQVARTPQMGWNS